jgi:hypothetical protein
MEKFIKVKTFPSMVYEIIKDKQLVGHLKDVDSGEMEPLYNKHVKLGKVTLHGTVKLHGTNAGVAYDRTTKTITLQSRNQKLGGYAGHFGFVEWFNENEESWQTLLSDICDLIKTDRIVVYMEWAGNGVQKVVGISNLDKFAYVFAVRDVDRDMWASNNLRSIFFDPEIRLFNSSSFTNYKIEVDLDNPHLAALEMDKLTLEVEDNCPVASTLDPHLATPIGEGIVWRTAPNKEGDVFWCKTKGEKHSKSAGGNKKARVKSAITVGHIQAADLFAEEMVSDYRVDQAFEIFQEAREQQACIQDMGRLIKWTVNDIMKEEQHTIKTSGLVVSCVVKSITNASRDKFIKRFHSFGGV